MQLAYGWEIYNGVYNQQTYLRMDLWVQFVQCVLIFLQQQCNMFNDMMFLSIVLFYQCKVRICMFNLLNFFHSKTDHSANVFQMSDKFNYKYVFILSMQCVNICLIF